MPGPHNRDKTHCPQGHAYSGYNLIIITLKHPDGTPTGRERRQCRECKIQSKRQRPAAIPIDDHGSAGLSPEDRAHLFATGHLPEDF
jgi:hypothetical protein